MATAQTITASTVVPLRPRSKTKAKRARKPKPRDVVGNVKAVIAMRDELKAAARQRRELDEQIAAEQHEHRWGGLRSIALLALMSAVLVGMLVAGVTGG
jgi:hypothetical protein